MTRFRLTRKRLIIASCVGIPLLVAAYFVFRVAGIFLIVASQIHATKKQEARLSTPAIYQPVAQRLALYCQSDLKLIPEYISPAWFPPEMSGFPYGHGQVRKDGAN